MTMDLYPNPKTFLEFDEKAAKLTSLMAMTKLADFESMVHSINHERRNFTDA